MNTSPTNFRNKKKIQEDEERKDDRPSAKDAKSIHAVAYPEDTRKEILTNEKEIPPNFKPGGKLSQSNNEKSSSKIQPNDGGIISKDTEFNKFWKPQNFQENGDSSSKIQTNDGNMTPFKAPSLDEISLSNLLADETSTVNNFNRSPWFNFSAGNSTGGFFDHIYDEEYIGNNNSSIIQVQDLHPPQVVNPFANNLQENIEQKNSRENYVYIENTDGLTNSLKNMSLKPVVPPLDLSNNGTAPSIESLMKLDTGGFVPKINSNDLMFTPTNPFQRTPDSLRSPALKISRQQDQVEFQFFKKSEVKKYQKSRPIQRKCPPKLEVKNYRKTKPKLPSESDETNKPISRGLLESYRSMFPERSYEKPEIPERIGKKSRLIFDKKTQKKEEKCITWHYCEVENCPYLRHRRGPYNTDRADNFKKHQIGTHYPVELKKPINCAAMIQKSDGTWVPCHYRSVRCDDATKHMKARHQGCKTLNKNVDWKWMSTEEYISVLKQNEGFLLDVADRIWVKWNAEFNTKTKTKDMKTEHEDWINRVANGELFPALPDLRKDQENRSKQKKNQQPSQPYIKIFQYELDLREFIEELAGWLLLWRAPETKENKEIQN